MKNTYFQLAKRYRSIGRTLETAKEIAGVIEGAERILDLGCGAGYVAYHLQAILHSEVVGTDILPKSDVEAPIIYTRFDGESLPFEDNAFDGAVVSFVLHHAAHPLRLLSELRRVLRQGAKVVVFEDIPDTLSDQLLCLVHDHRWRSRSGPCNFQRAEVWRELFEVSGFDVEESFAMSRLHDWSHPVRRARFTLETTKPRGS